MTMWETWPPLGLGPDHTAIGKPVEPGVYRTLAQAQFHADIELNVDRMNRRNSMMSTGAMIDLLVR